MEPLKNIKVLMVGVLLMLSTNSQALAAGDIVSAADAQHFEQTYEDWAKTLIKGINPKLSFTALAQIEFSRNPERVQEYEDLKSANHLPGLPEMADPTYSTPLESPLYALVQKKDIKIIFSEALSAQEAEVAKEVLTSKLKITANDSLKFETVKASAKPAHGKSSSPIRANKTWIYTLLAGLAIFAGGILTARKKKSSSVLSAIDAAHATAAAGLPPAVNPTLSASHQIQMASPEMLRKVLAGEKPELIARASLNATKKFSNRILGECEQSKFDMVIQWINANHKSITQNDSNYARLLLAARIQQVQNAAVLNSIDAFNKAREKKAQLEAQKIYKIVPAKEVNEAIL